MGEVGPFTSNTSRGDIRMNVDEIFNSPLNTPCKLEKGIYEIKTLDNSEGYLFKITPVTGKTGIYSINAPDPATLDSTYRDTQIGTVNDLSRFISTGNFHIINGPGIDVGVMLILIESIGDGGFYKLICDTSPATGGRGRGPYKQLTVTHHRTRGRSRGSRRRTRRRRTRRRRTRRHSRRGRSRRNRKN